MDLMNFPPITQVLWDCGAFLFTGPVALLIGAALWFVFLRLVYRTVRDRLRQPEGETGPAGGTSPLRGLAGFGLIPTVVLLIGAGHFYAVYYETIYTALWWHIKPEQIAEVEVVRLPKEGEQPVGPPVYIRDPALLRDGFSRLADAKSYTRDHESFREGYILRIREAGAASFSDRYLAVFRQSSRRGAVPLVIPFRGPRTDEWTYGKQGGEYVSPAFGAWVAAVIDPRFAGRHN